MMLHFCEQVEAKKADEVVQRNLENSSKVFERLFDTVNDEIERMSRAAANGDQYMRKFSSMRSQVSHRLIAEEGNLKSQGKESADQAQKSGVRRRIDFGSPSASKSKAVPRGSHRGSF